MVHPTAAALPCCNVALVADAGTIVHSCTKGVTAFDFFAKHAVPACFAQVLGSSADLSAPIVADTVIDVRSPAACSEVRGALSDTDVKQALQGLAHFLPVQIECVPPDLATAIAGLTLENARQSGCFQGFLQPCSRILLPFAHDAHWACLCVQVESTCLRIRYLDGVPGRLADHARHFAAVIAALLGHESHDFIQESWFLQVEDGTCGAIMLRHLCACAVGLGPHVEGLLAQLLQEAPQPGRVSGAGGLSQEQTASLKAFLKKECRRKALMAASRLPLPSLDRAPLQQPSRASMPGLNLKQLQLSQAICFVGSPQTSLSSTLKARPMQSLVPVSPMARLRRDVSQFSECKRRFRLIQQSFRLRQAHL